MILGLVTIQRDRGPWLLEWFAFHYLVGFRKFYFYAHMCQDDTVETLLKLKKRLDINVIALPSPGDRIQLQAYQHACQNYMNEVDWMGFIDGDEFLFPTKAYTMQEALWQYDSMPASALGVYNVNYGSSGHVAEPEGLITENFRMRAEDSFYAHSRVKSLVKGRQQVAISSSGHVFATPGGTVDEQMRPITWGFMPDYVPSYRQFRMNHYVCQSREYYEKHKRASGHADASAAAIREEEWWTGFNTNHQMDDSMARYNARLRATMEELRLAMEA
jgi:hypothetical protein